MVATSHVWLLSTWNIEQVQLGFCFWNVHFILTNVKLNRHICLVSTGQHARWGTGSQSVVFRAAAWFVRNANSQASPQMHWIRSSAGRTQHAGVDKPLRWFWHTLMFVRMELGPFKIAGDTCFKWTLPKNCYSEWGLLQIKGLENH